jgi:arylsulfatase A-like enzyme
MNRSVPMLLGALLVLWGSAAQAQRPNFVFFLVDDLGYMDIGANNPDTFYETPNIDRLAARGMRFTQGYAANPVCSPTRYSILTGRYPTRAGATNWFSGVREGRFKPAPLNDRMPLEEVTLAEALQEHGYRTAFLGKWHLGPSEEFWPEQQGFDINVGGHDRGSPPGGYFAPWNNPRLENGPRGEFLTQRLTDESIAILEQLQEQPFLLYLSFYTVHTPLQAPAELVAKYEAKAERLGLNGQPEFGTEEQAWPTDEPRRVRILQKHATYAAMVESMDAAVGRVLDKLDQLGLTESTTVCFFSDNGGLSTSEGLPTSNLPLRGGKGWTYEGGIREPMIIASPGLTAAGSVCDEPVISTDFYPTLLDIAGLPLRPDQHLDGVSLKPLLQGAGADSLPPRALYWHYPHYSNQGGFPSGAIRVGDWKFIERYEDGSGQLFNLADDVGEEHNLIEEHPERASALRKQLHEWYKTVDARFLQPKEGRQPWSPEG